MHLGELPACAHFPAGQRYLRHETCGRRGARYDAPQNGAFDKTPSRTGGLFMRTKLLLVSVFAAIAFAVMLPVPAAAESTWDQIKRTGKLRYGAIDYPPNWYRDKTTGKWTGFLVEVIEDVAKEMGVEAVPVETTWATCVLDLQSNKTDVQFGLQATPKRALVIDFAGPAYQLYWYAVNHQGVKASTWEEHNKPELNTAALLGRPDAVILQKVAPRAPSLDLNAVASPARAVPS